MAVTDQTVFDAQRPGKATTAFRAIDEALSAVSKAISQSTSVSTDAVHYSLCNPPAGIYSMAAIHEADRQIARLNTLRGAKSGWAGPGSEAPNETSLKAAIAMIERLRHWPIPMPMASIGSHGNAGLFWQDAKLYADIELLEDGKVGYLLQQSGKPTVDDEADIPEKGLPPAIAAAIAGAYLKNLK